MYIKHSLIWLSLLLSLLFLSACGDSLDTDQPVDSQTEILSTGDSVTDSAGVDDSSADDTANIPPETGDALRGEALYNSDVQQCIQCHDEQGISPAFPINNNQTYSHSSDPDTALSLSDYIELWMPVSDINTCTGECAQDIAAYIRSWNLEIPNDNSGDDGSGDDNSGDDSSGDDNSGDDSSGDDSSGDNDSGDTPDVTPTPNPTIADIANGQSLFADHDCALCHDLTSDSPNIETGIEASTISDAIMNVASMASYQHTAHGNGTVFSAQEMFDLAAYIDQALTLASTPSLPPTEPSTPVDCSDMQTLMQSPELNCTNSSCHSATPSLAAKIALTGSVEQIAARLADVDSVNANCSGEKIIDVNNPSNSFLLKLIGANADSQCSTKMPIGLDSVSAEHFACFEQWINDIVAVAPELSETEYFVPTSALSGLNKSKALLHGGAITEAEFNNISVDGIFVDQANLKTTIEDWLETPQFEEKFKGFLTLSLQQKNVSTDPSYENQFNILINAKYKFGGFMDSLKVRDNFEESFIRTAYRIFNDEEDFRQIATTRDWEVTTALLWGLSYADNESGLVRMRFFTHLCGDFYSADGDDINCGDTDDYSDWRTVSLTQASSPAVAEYVAQTAENLRSIPDGGSLALMAPRVGFFTTPVFFQSWESNVGNKFRVTANQAMIVGLGLTYQAGDTTAHGDLSGLDAEHAGEDNPECYACHRLMDPMTQIFDNHYNVSTSRALASPGNTPAAFAFFGAQAELNTLDDFGQAIANHPKFASAWTGKLCTWANSAPCDESGSEFKRLVEVFVSSGYDMKTLLIEMFASPLITGVAYVDDFALTTPQVVINRSNHFCNTVKNRLNQVRLSRGLPESSSAELCSLNDTTVSKAALIPKDLYNRGVVHLIQPVSFDPFLAKGYEQLCAAAADSVVQNAAGTGSGDSYNAIFDASEIDRSIEEMVTYVMAMPPSSANHNNTVIALRKLYDIQTNTTSCDVSGLDPITDNESDLVCGLGVDSITAIKKVWNWVCASPSVIGMGF